MLDSYVDNLAKWLLIISLSAILLYFGRLLFEPMLFSLLIAFVMYPLCLWLEKKGLSKYLAITTCIIIVFLLLLLLVGMLFWQFQLFKEDIPLIAEKFKPVWLQWRTFLHQNFSITLKMQDEWLHNLAYNSGDKVSGILSNLFNATAGVIFMLFLIPAYFALFLFHRSVFVHFIEMIFGLQHKIQLQTVLQETIFTFSNYIKGMMMIYLIVGALNSVGLLALGIKHAVLFGMLTAIMTIIPYVGIVISALLPISIAFITKDSIWYPLGVVGVFTFVQYLEANVIFPKVVGKQLNVSTWATLVAIMAGGIIWGVAGMILFIPFVAILKIIAKHIPEWKALYFILDRNGKA